MSELFDETEEEVLSVDVDELVADDFEISPSDARRRLENMLAEKKLREELEDFLEGNE